MSHISWVRNLGKRNSWMMLLFHGASQRWHAVADGPVYRMEVASFTFQWEWMGGWVQPRWSTTITCHNGHRTDFLNGSSWLEKQSSHKQGRNCMAFHDLGSEVTRWQFLSYPPGQVVTNPPRFEEVQLVLKSRTFLAILYNIYFKDFEVKVTCTEPWTYTFRIACFKGWAWQKRNRVTAFKKTGQKQQGNWLIRNWPWALLLPRNSELTRQRVV